MIVRVANPIGERHGPCLPGCRLSVPHLTGCDTRPAAVMPGTAGVVAAVMAETPTALIAAVDGLVPVRLCDGSGAVLYPQVWVPPGSRVVVRGRRVFVHWDQAQWRQVPVVYLGEDDRPYEPRR